MAPYGGRDVIVRFDRSYIYIDRAALQTALPGYRGFVTDPHLHCLDIDEVIRRSHLVHHRNAEKRTQRAVWEHILEGLRTSSGPCQGLTLTLGDMLQHQYHWDESFQREHSNTMVLFSCLAEISNQFESDLIGSTLTAFWNRRGHHIVQRADNLVPWVRSIMRACIYSEASKLTALQVFSSADPRVLRDLQLSPKTAGFVQALEDIRHNGEAHDLMMMPLMADNGFFPPSQDRPPIISLKHRHYLNDLRSKTPPMDMWLPRDLRDRRRVLQLPPLDGYDTPATRTDVENINMMLDNTNRRLYAIEDGLAENNRMTADLLDPYSHISSRPALFRSHSATPGHRSIGPAPIYR